jgi:malate dehydrogenase (oxaloacetate-decarboxylating)
MKEQGLSDEQARRRIYAFNHLGLLVEGCQGVKPGQEAFLRKRDDVDGWKLSASESRAISLLDVVRNAGITVLAGVSAQAGAFTEEIVREMARHTPHPVIFPLSNPTSQAEATPADLLRWTEGRALVGTGSPFAPVEVNGKLIRIAQVNNSYIFPGLALGILVSRATRVTDGMIMAAAKALALLSPARADKNAPLLPPIADARRTSAAVAEAVFLQAIADGVAGPADEDAIAADLRAYMWEPVYQTYERADSAK